MMRYVSSDSIRLGVHVMNALNRSNRVNRPAESDGEATPFALDIAANGKKGGGSRYPYPNTSPMAPFGIRCLSSLSCRGFCFL